MACDTPAWVVTIHASSPAISAAARNTAASPSRTSRTRSASARRLSPTLRAPKTCTKARPSGSGTGRPKEAAAPAGASTARRPIPRKASAASPAIHVETAPRGSARAAGLVMGATMRGPPLALNCQLCKTDSRFRNMDWDDLRVFRAVAEAPTLTAAARHLGASVATVARRIDALEATLGFRLFDRSRAGVTLTTRGRAISARAALAGNAVDDVARLAASLQTGAWPDPIRISATEPIVSDILAPALPKLLAAAPDIRVDLSSSTDVVSLAGREADVAVRLARPVGDSLVVRRLPPFDLGLFAAKSYLAGRRPADLDLRRERLLGFDASYGRIAEVAWMEKSGLAGAVVVRSSSTRALINATRAGAGIALLPQFLVRSDPTLLEIPGPTPMPRRPAWLVTHRDLRHARPLQIVREWISGAVRAAQGA